MQKHVNIQNFIRERIIILRTYTHTFIHTYIHTYIHICTRIFNHRYSSWYIHTCMFPWIHPEIYKYVANLTTYIHTCIQGVVQASHVAYLSSSDLATADIKEKREITAKESGMTSLYIPTYIHTYVHAFACTGAFGKRLGLIIRAGTAWRFIWDIS